MKTRPQTLAWLFLILIVAFTVALSFCQRGWPFAVVLVGGAVSIVGALYYNDLARVELEEDEKNGGE